MQERVTPCCCQTLKLGSLCLAVTSFIGFFNGPGEEAWLLPIFDERAAAATPRPLLRPGKSSFPHLTNQTQRPELTGAVEVNQSGSWDASVSESPTQGSNGSGEGTGEVEPSYDESQPPDYDPSTDEDGWHPTFTEPPAPASYTPAELETGAWIPHLHRRERKIYSQQGEAMPVFSQYYVEFGVEAGAERNTRALQEKFGWTGLLLDGSHHDDRINLHEEFITAEGIVGLFQKHKVPLRFGLLSVDIDSYDWWVLKSILEGGYRPDVIVTEVNTQVERGLFTIAPANVTGAKRISPDSFAFGATPEAFAALQAAYGYAMIYCEHRGVNCFAVRRGNLSAEYLPPPDKALHPPPMYSGFLECRKQKEDNVLPWYEIAADLSVKRTAVYPKPCQECRLDGGLRRRLAAAGGPFAAEPEDRWPRASPEAVAH